MESQSLVLLSLLLWSFQKVQGHNLAHSLSIVNQNNPSEEKDEILQKHEGNVEVERTPTINSRSYDNLEGGQHAPAIDLEQQQCGQNIYIPVNMCITKDALKRG